MGQQRNTKASETKQPKIETKQNKKRNATLSLFSKPQIFSSFKSLLSLETSSLSFCFNLSHTSKPSNQVLIIILIIKRNLALQDNPSIYTHTYKKEPSDLAFSVIP